MNAEFEEIKILANKCSIFCKKAILLYWQHKLDVKKRNNFIAFQRKMLSSNNFI